MAFVIADVNQEGSRITSSEQWVEIHHLRQQGLSIRKIAGVVGKSRNAVRRALRSAAPPTGKRSRAQGIKLEPYFPLIKQWLRDPVKTHWTAERIFNELTAHGYVGGRTVVKTYVRKHRPRPVKSAEARFYVKPGQQMQVDWAELGVHAVDGVARKLYVFVAIMAWSRQLFVHFTTDMHLLSWLDCHCRAFAYFGGVPAEVLIDNLKTGVVSRAGGTVRWQKDYEQLSVAYGFRPIAHFPRRPKTKGRVERIVRFVRQNFFEGREFTSLDDLNERARTWLRSRANDRIHRVTRERPADRFSIERAALQPLAEYEPFLEEPRVADAYALVSVNGVRYSVPPMYARTPVTLHLQPSEFSVLISGKAIVRHAYAKPGVRLVQLPEHLPPKPKPRHEQFTAIGERITVILGELGARYVNAVERKAPHAPVAILREVLERLAEFDHQVVVKALETLLEFQVIKRGELSRLCYRFGSPTPALSTVAALPTLRVERRSLAVYDALAVAV
jgi:transposase